MIRVNQEQTITNHTTVQGLKVFRVFLSHQITSKAVAGQLVNSTLLSEKIHDPNPPGGRELKGTHTLYSQISRSDPKQDGPRQ